VTRSTSGLIRSRSPTAHARNDVAQLSSTDGAATRFGAPDSTGFVTLLYQNVLGRAPDQFDAHGR